MTQLATPGSPTPPPTPDSSIRPGPDGWEVVARRDGAFDLSELLPITEAFGFRIVDARTTHDEAGTTQRLRILLDGQDDDDTARRLDDALAAALAGDTRVDGLLRLVASTTLDWVEVDRLRALRRMLELLGSSRPGVTIDRALVDNPAAARALSDLFTARLAPDAPAAATDTARTALDTVRAEVADLTADRAIADLTTVLEAILRTNAYAPTSTVVLDGVVVPLLALKFDSHALPSVPEPIPWAEVLVTSPLTTGVHLRAGPIARGGLRASDRLDVRHEVLDLMAAQVVKNSVIVPTGAKGGFLVHDGPKVAGDRAMRVRRAYEVFITGLLSVTDDVDGDAVVGPDRVRCRDGDDPYLVVAADKGTARLSDTANELADAHGFWLGDAFASGGSSGWDHKALGVTARGAWTAIARHFRELGIDILTDAISVVGIGDMSGDVFGNGLLTSATLRLQAAFDHRDVFVDPSPDPAASFAERRRLFDLPTSSWQDYDREVLSRGGIIAARSAKSIPLTDEVRDLLGVDDDALAPDELVGTILRMKVDLLYAGGIGTVVKASDEDFRGDHANDDIRIDADQLDARVVGEGANLAITPRGRIEYARRGGRIDQDAIHNAGGVATSDREVNAKILFASAITAGRLDRAARDEVLQAAADEVVRDVCRDVDAQVWLLSRAHASSAADLAAHARHLDRLADAGDVDRVVDLLPDTEDLQARAAAGAGLTRPELATMMAATKRRCTEALAGHDLLATDSAAPALRSAFATPIRTHPAVDLHGHRLAEEITALRIASGLVDRFGITHLDDVADRCGRALSDVLAAHWRAQVVLDGHDWWGRLQDCAGVVPDATLESTAARLAGLQAEVAVRLLRNAPVPGAAIDADVDRHRRVARLVRDAWRDRPRGPVARHRTALLDDLVPDDLALDASLADELTTVPDLAAIIEPEPSAVTAGLQALGHVGSRLHLAALEEAVSRHLVDATGPEGGWRRRHGEDLEVDLGRVRRRLALATRARPDALGGEDVDDVRARVVAALRAVRDDADLAADALGSAVAAVRHLDVGSG